MPKVIEKYVLQQKIGGGQFGDVYRGHHQQTGEIVAVKSIRRQTIKGKFYQLLQNEIKVLKTCDNPHIMKLYSLKKTPNNYYLMLEYCDGGDMLAKVKKMGRLHEEDVIRYTCQIISGFQTLVKHKIMHRDFKLANVLLHCDRVKIADFGFAKLLGQEEYATTMLGSPLNMAPEVLGGTKYNSKADIWSIGACVYEMVFGKPPFIAGNMVDLLKLIKTKPLTFPADIPISQPLRDLLKRMLVPDVKRRMSWTQLFSHPINTCLDHLKRKEVDLQLVEDESLVINTSKYYLKNNLIIEQPEEIVAKQGVNQYLVDVIRSGKKNGSCLANQEKKQQLQIEKPKQHTKSITNSSSLKSVFRKNSKLLLHYRNIYAFLATVADQTTQSTNSLHFQIASYMLVHKILEMISWLKQTIESKQCKLQGIEHWEEYYGCTEWQQIRGHVTNEQDVFKVFGKSLQPIIKEKILTKTYDLDVTEAMLGNFKESTYRKYLTAFAKPFISTTIALTIKQKDYSTQAARWKQIHFLLIALEASHIFGSGTGNHQFNFKELYEGFEKKKPEEALLQIEDKIRSVIK